MLQSLKAYSNSDDIFRFSMKAVIERYTREREELGASAASEVKVHSTLPERLLFNVFLSASVYNLHTSHMHEHVFNSSPKKISTCLICYASMALYKHHQASIKLL